MFELHDKVALITGAAGGLGDKIARTLHKQGATLALTDMRAEPVTCSTRRLTISL